jgi:nitrite reductase (NADH) large subunit
VSGLVVVGGGIAGQAVAEGVRARDPRMPIAILAAEARAPYDRVRLSALLAEGGDPEALRLRPATWYEDNAVALRTGTAVARIDRRARRVVTAAGEAVAYDALCLCTGSRAAVPPIPGIDQAGSFVFRTPEDCAAILGAARGARRACVIGGGLLGLEAARGLVEHGVEVVVVHLEGHLMERQLDGPGGGVLAARMAGLGVEVMLGRRTERVLGEGRVTGLRFAGGDELACDLLVTCVGIRADLELAREAGLATGRGVLVDDALRTGDPAIWAVGECAEHRGVVHGLVAPIHDQARVAAAAIAGAAGGAAYEGSVPATALKVMGVDLVSAGDPLGEGGCAVHDAGRGVYRRLAVRDGRAVGAILVGDTRGADALAALVARNAELSDPLVTLAESAGATAAELPDDARVCSCHGVTKGDVLAAIRERGLRAAGEVQACTRAGTGCGGCRPLLRELVAAETGDAAAEPAYLCPCRGLTRDDLAEVIRERDVRSAGELGAACGAGRDCGACKPGIAYLVSLLNANRHAEERHARFINDRVHANIQRDGSFSVVPRIRGGVTSPEELRRIADVAERYRVRMVKITGGQRIDLLGVRKEDLPAIWAELGMPSGFAYSKAIRTVKTCVGTDFCRFGIGDAIGLGIELERRLEGLHTPHKVKMAVSGCPRNCAEASVKDIGIIAVEGGWEVRVGGAAGASVREADVLARVATEEDALRAATTFLQYYRENAEYLERTYGFVQRLGIEAIAKAVLDEGSGEPAALRERLAMAKEAVSDPWQDAVAAGDRSAFEDLGADPALVGPPPDGAPA